MKRFRFFLVLALFLIAGNAMAQKKSDPVVYFKSNMHCGDCEKSLFEHLRFERGVKDLHLDHVSNTIKVIYAEKRTGEEALKKAVEKKGYAAEKISEKEYAELVEKAKKEPGTNAGHHHH
jgi:copper chaperone CopZ